jgi:chorismate mutase
VTTSLHVIEYLDLHLSLIFFNFSLVIVNDLFILLDACIGFLIYTYVKKKKKHVEATYIPKIFNLQPARECRLDS